MGPDDMVGVEESLYLEDAQHLWLFCGEGLGAPLLGAGDPQEACLWGTDPPGWLLNQPQKGPEARIHLLRIFLHLFGKRSSASLPSKSPSLHLAAKLSQ